MDFRVRFQTIFRCLGGAAGNSFGDIFRFLEARFFHEISDTFLEGFFTLPGRFWTPSGIVFETFGWLSALAETVPPLARELRFRCFKRSETRFFPASLSKGLAETISSTFRRILGSAGHPAAPLWAPWGAYFADGFRRDFGCQNDGFLGSATKRENRSSLSSGLAREEKIYFGHDSWYHAT